MIDDACALAAKLRPNMLFKAVVLPCHTLPATMTVRRSCFSIVTSLDIDFCILVVATIASFSFSSKAHIFSASLDCSTYNNRM